MAEDISRRKRDHLDLAASGQVDFRASTLLEHVRLVHQALPELALDDIDLTTRLAGNTLAAPVVVSGMTGGTEEAGKLNRDLARACQELGLAFGLGSQRAMLVKPETTDTFRVREVAPDVVLFGNLGVVQARELGVAGVRTLVETVGADALCIHLNPAMELVQTGGDRDFKGAIETLVRLALELPVPVIVKETGCGLSLEAARIIKQSGIQSVDVSGAGGTSWVAVEAMRAAEGSPQRALGDSLWDWGIPTAVSTAMCAGEGLEVIATGGLRSGFDVARAMALGATAGGLAAPVLRAHREGGYDGAVAFLKSVIDGVRTVTLLSGQRRSCDLSKAVKFVESPLRDWLRDLACP